MERILYHGSEKIVLRPAYGVGKQANDYGRGFYCTEEKELAGEWACKKGRDGFVNKYKLDMTGLQVVNLNDSEYTILNWLALLTKYRGYWQAKSVAEQAKNYLQERYLPDISEADIIVGYRADDSYFSFAQDFIMGAISLQKLAMAMKLGKLGEQVVLKSRESFENLLFEGYTCVSAEEYYKKKLLRDREARHSYTDAKNASNYMDDIFIIDIMRGRVSDDDLRI